MFRSERLRRAVCSLPCVSCGVLGHTQAAHGGQKYGKGMGIKASDAALMALCCDRPGVRGCHSKLDQGGRLTRDDKEALQDEWIARTLVTLIERGVLVLGEVDECTHEG